MRLNNKFARLSLPIVFGIGFLTFFGDRDAYADIVVEFSDGNGVGTSFDFVVGSTRTVSVFATESAPDTDLSVDGLVGFGLAGTYSATSGASAVVSATTINSDFDFTNDDSFSATEVNLAAITLANSPVRGGSVLLASFDVQLNAVGTTEFIFDDYTPGAFSDFASSTGTDLDPIVFVGGRQFNLTINAVAVPEPFSGLVIAGVMVCGIARRRRRLVA